MKTNFFHFFHSYEPVGGKFIGGRYPEFFDEKGLQTYVICQDTKCSKCGKEKQFTFKVKVEKYITEEQVNQAYCKSGPTLLVWWHPRLTIHHEILQVMITDLEQIASEIANSRVRLLNGKQSPQDIVDEVKQLEGVEYNLRKLISKLKDTLDEMRSS